MNPNITAWFYIWEHCNDVFICTGQVNQNHAKFMARWGKAILEEIGLCDTYYVFKDLMNEKLSEAKSSGARIE